ncbi:uncharacterized protein G2W53_043777 [Senna tora]|uniref:Uncharacterized protein n=1 Tax=Senna tora TaxID=362788 RepID=A0A834W3Q3_9FABA|nr:uncharacterized protein G2W53_043777 [Senna tora]
MAYCRKVLLMVVVMVMLIVLIDCVGAARPLLEDDDGGWYRECGHLMQSLQRGTGRPSGPNPIHS